jgi:hypothetical protein
MTVSGGIKALTTNHPTVCVIKLPARWRYNYRAHQLSLLNLGPINCEYLIITNDLIYCKKSLDYYIFMKVTTKKAAIEKQMAQLEKELKSIESSAAFKKEYAIKRALTNVMKKHGCSQNDLIALLQGDQSEPVKRRKKPTANKRKPRS